MGTWGYLSPRVSGEATSSNDLEGEISASPVCHSDTSVHQCQLEGDVRELMHRSTVSRLVDSYRAGRAFLGLPSGGESLKKVVLGNASSKKQQ